MKPEVKSWASLSANVLVRSDKIALLLSELVLFLTEIYGEFRVFGPTLIKTGAVTCGPMGRIAIPNCLENAYPSSVQADTLSTSTEQRTNKALEQRDRKLEEAQEDRAVIRAQQAAAGYVKSTRPQDRAILGSDTGQNHHSAESIPKARVRGLEAKIYRPAPATGL